MNNKLIFVISAVAIGGVLLSVRHQNRSDEPAIGVRINPGTGLPAPRAEKLSGGQPVNSKDQNIRARVEDLRSRFKGDDLSLALSRAGAGYAKSSLAEAKEFMLALPPGYIGLEAFRATISELKTDAPEVIKWLTEPGLPFNREWIGDGMIRAVSNWRRADVTGLVKALSVNENLSEQAKAAYLASALSGLKGMSDSSIDSILNLIPDEQLRRQATIFGDVLQAKLLNDPSKTVNQIANETDPKFQSEALNNLAWAANDLADPLPVLDSIMNSPINNKSPTVSTIVGIWVQRDLNSALSWLSNVQDADMKNAAIAASWQTIAKDDKAAAAAWIAQITNDGLRLKAENGLKNLQ